MTNSERAERLAELIEDRMGIRGPSLEKKAKKAGRSLPKWARSDIRAIVEASKAEGNPKLARMIDERPLERGYRNIVAHLETIDPWDRRKDRAIGFVAANAFNIMITFAFMIGILAWRGLI